MTAVVTEQLDDGCVRITVGEFSGVVSSWHLVEPKARQLIAAAEAAATMQTSNEG